MSGLGYHTFTLASHPDAKEVFVTGTFDDWTKSVQLEKNGDTFEKKVDLPTDKKVLYKYFVDGDWLLDPSKPKEDDEHGFSNNVLQTTDITPHPASTAAIASVGAAASTVAMAGSVPKEAEKAAGEGGTFSVNPIPATEGTGNPIHLPAGAPVPDPSTLTSNTVASTVKTGEEAYNKSDAGAASKEAELFTMPPITKNFIPESSLPLGTGTEPFLAGSVAPGSTTAALAGKVPLEGATVPETVKESISEAHVSPEAAANPVAVEEKKEVEDELKSKVPEEPATSGDGVSKGGLVAGATAAATAAGASVLAAAGLAQHHSSGLVASTQAKAAGTLSDAKEAFTSAIGGQPPTAPGVPEVVKESISEAYRSPEAAANAEAVREKGDVEAELLKKVHDKDAAKEGEASAGAAPAEGEAGPATPAKDEAAPPPAAAVTEPEPSEASVPKPTTDKKSKRKSFFNKIKKILN